MKWRHCIVEIVDSYARARGNYDFEYVVCRMTNGKTRDFEADDLELESFIANKEAYWNQNGFDLIEKPEGKKTLRARA